MKASPTKQQNNKIKIYKLFKGKVSSVKEGTVGKTILTTRLTVNSFFFLWGNSLKPTENMLKNILKQFRQIFLTNKK